MRALALQRYQRACIWLIVVRAHTANRIGDASASIIAAAVEKNTALTSLDLRGERFRMRGGSICGSHCVMFCCACMCAGRGDVCEGNVSVWLVRARR